MQRAPFSLRTSIGAERLGVERNFPKMEVGGRGLGAFATVPNVCRMREVGKESKGGRQRGEGVDFAQLVEKGKWEIWLKEPKGVPWREVDERPWSSVSVYVFFFCLFHPRGVLVSLRMFLFPQSKQPLTYLACPHDSIFGKSTHGFSREGLVDVGRPLT